MLNLTFLEALTNPENGAKRVTYALKSDPDKFIVIKLFDGDGSDEVWTFKVWQGDYDTVKSYWKTQTTFVPTKEDRERLQNVLNGALTFMVSFTDTSPEHRITHHSYWE